MPPDPNQQHPRWSSIDRTFWGCSVKGEGKTATLHVATEELCICTLLFPLLPPPDARMRFSLPGCPTIGGNTAERQSMLALQFGWERDRMTATWRGETRDARMIAKEQHGIGKAHIQKIPQNETAKNTPGLVSKDPRPPFAFWAKAASSGKRPLVQLLTWTRRGPSGPGCGGP